MTTSTAVQDQKKRTLDALERRFALEAENLQQQTKKKKHYEEKDNATRCIHSSSSTLHPTIVSVAPSLNLDTSSRKGKFFTSGSTTTQDAELNGPTYLQLSHTVHENLMVNSVKSSNRRGSAVDHILHELLQSGDSSQKYLQGSRAMKIDNWILLDNFVHKRTGGVKTNVFKSQSKRSKRCMSTKQHKKCGSFTLPQEFQNYDIYKQMHEMWKGYMVQLLKNVGKAKLAQCLLGADLHGAIILVVQCKIAGVTGVNGIMIRETAETFGIITKENKFRVVPKRVSVFMFQVDSWKITLHGDKLAVRNIGQG